MRVKRGTTSHRRHKKLLGRAKGYRGLRRKTVKKAHEAVLHAGRHAFIDRRRKKLEFRSLWITRLNAALRSRGMMYSRFISAAEANNIQLNRKVLSELAISEPQVFDAVVKAVMGK